MKLKQNELRKYVFNNDCRDAYEKNRIVITDTHPNSNLVEIIKLKQHPYFVDCQFHLEFKSKPPFSSRIINT